VKGNVTLDHLNGTLEGIDGNTIVTEPIQVADERVIAINDAYVVDGDHFFDEGVIHVVSKVNPPKILPFETP
jgi:hypothetical protein